MGIGAPVNSMQQQFAQQQALSAANQQRQQQDPRYARTQTPEFQAYVAQQRDLEGKMNSYMNMNPNQADVSLAQRQFDDLPQVDKDVTKPTTPLGMPMLEQRRSFMPGIENMTKAAVEPTVAEETPPASIGGKGGGVPAPAPIGGKGGPVSTQPFQPQPFPSDNQRQPDTPSGLGGKGGASMPPQQMPSGYDQSFPAYQGPSNGSGGDLGFGGGGGGQKKLTLGEVGLTFDPSGGGGGGGGSMQAYAEGGNVSAAPQGLAALGRGNDTQLVHMTPREVGAMQNLAMSQGGSLTINPHTGLPEAGFLDSMLPTILGIGANFLLPGSGALIGAGIGALQTARTGDLGKGIMAGLGAYGGAGIGEGLASMGASATNNVATTGLNAAADSAGSMGNAAYQNALTNNTPMIDRLTDVGVSPQQFAQQEAEAAANAFPSPASPTPNAPIFGSQQLGNAAAGAQQLGTTQGWSDLANKVGTKTLMSAAAAPVMDALQPPPVEFAPPSPMGQAKKYTYDPKTQQYVLLAGGGEITHMAEGSYIPDSKRVNTNIYDARKEKERIAKLQQLIAALSGPPNSASLNALEAPVTQMAHGGIASLPEYAAGGKLLQGPGDGMSDSIPAVIKGARPQRAALAQGEFVIPADVVSHLGNGSTDAGAKRLYAMMDKVRHARTGNKKQGKQINPDRFLPT